MHHQFLELWNEFLKKSKLPDACTGHFEISNEEFKSLLIKFDRAKSFKIVNNLMEGKVLIIKKAFSDNFVQDLKSKVKIFWTESESSFYPMTEGCPDFHRIVTPELSKNYSVGAVRHSTYFFPWNNDPCKINEKIYETWRLFKTFSGLHPKEYEKNTPKNGAVDRIQIACYPPGHGGVEVHVDITKHNFLAISCYLSSLENKDFSTGGFYCVDKNDKKINLEKSISCGDISLYCPTIKHGVSAIDEHQPKKKINWNSGEGRWWMGLFTMDSNLVKNRLTSKSLGKRQSERI